jgi:hypothetical protein
MWQLVEPLPKTHRVTRRLAREFAEMEPAPKDRPLSERRLQVYTLLMNKGEFRPMSWASILCKETGVTYRVNGKHTSTICATLDPLPELFAVVERYECDTLDDVGRLYGTYDSKMQARTTADINRSFASCVPGLADIPVKILNACAGGMSFATYFQTYRHQEQPAERAERLLEHSDFVVWLNATLFHGATSKNSHLMRVPVVACVFQSYQKDEGKAREFWLAVRDETGLAPDLPDRKLAKYLTTSISSTGARVHSGVNRFRVTDREHYAKCVMAWNAWRKGETTTMPYKHDRGIPELV